ncbi:hypothetical protein D3C73_1042800 [compost metagenome]
MRRIPIRRPAERLLGAADRLAGVGANDPVRRTCIVLLRAQQILQLDPFGAAQRQVILGPGASDQAGAIEALGQQAYGQGIGR